MADLSLEFDERVEQLTKSLVYAEKIKSREPFKPTSYMNLSDIYIRRSDWKSAEFYSELGQSLAPSSVDILLDRAGIKTGYGEQIIDRKQRKEYFNSVIELLERSISRIDDKNRGYYHFYLGHCHQILRDYDKSRTHFQIAKNMNFHAMASCIFMANNCLEQDQLDFARTDLDEAMHHFLASYKKFSKSHKQKQKKSRLDSRNGSESLR